MIGRGIIGLSVATAFLAMFQAVGEAAIVVTVDTNRNTPEIESSIEVRPGEIIQAAIVMEITSPNNLAGYQFTVRFSSDGLEIGPPWNSVEDPPFSGQFKTISRNDLGLGVLRPLTPLEDRRSVNDLGVIDSGLGRVGAFLDIDAGALEGGAGPGSRGVIFEFDLLVNSVGEFAIAPGFFDGFPGGGIDVQNQDVSGSFSFQGASVTAVPEPGSLIALTLLSAAGVVYRRRSRSTRK